MHLVYNYLVLLLLPYRTLPALGALGIGPITVNNQRRRAGAMAFANRGKPKNDFAFLVSGAKYMWLQIFFAMA